MIGEAATLKTVFTLPQVAKMAGWSVSRMRRHLLAKHAELEGGLLCNVSRGAHRPRWTITLAALQAIAPQWFIDPESTQRQIEWLTEQLDEQRAMVAALSRRLTAQHERFVAFAQASSAEGRRRVSPRSRPNQVRARRQRVPSPLRSAPSAGPDR